MARRKAFEGHMYIKCTQQECEQVHEKGKGWSRQGECGLFRGE